MKEVQTKDLPVISGGDYKPDGCDPKLPVPGTESDFPRNPFSPVYESPYAKDE